MQVRLVRALLFLLFLVGSLFVYSASVALEDGRRLIGVCASGAQIAGSFVCPYLVVGPQYCHRPPCYSTAP